MKELLECAHVHSTDKAYCLNIKNVEGQELKEVWFPISKCKADFQQTPPRFWADPWIIEKKEEELQEVLLVGEDDGE